MKRRTFGLMSACGATALAAGAGFPRKARAANAALLKGGSLTPMGSEIAGNADGSIPAWTGGLTEVPAGWTPGAPMPDPFASETPAFTISASNFAQYQDKLTAGTIAMIQTYGLTLNVFKTHRTHALQQWIYDNIALNADRAQPDPGGSRLGFTGAFGGYPFPIPNASDPLEAGAQAMWNHQMKFMGEHCLLGQSNYSMVDGQVTDLSSAKNWYRFPYYKQGGDPATDSKYNFQLLFVGAAPADNAGAQEMVWSSTNPLAQHSIAWEYLAGQGRVRKVPQIEYDIPEAQTNGLTFYDENWLFGGAMDRYDWKLVGKQEMYIPYNTNGVVQLTTAGMLPHFIDPALVRWELHRVWVIDATLHPGERHVVPHRRLYLDEDTWLAALEDEYDAQGNLWKVGMNFNMTRPDVPGTIFFAFVMYNLQQHGYVITANVDLGTPAGTHAFDFVTVPNDDMYNPQTMAERAQY
jgi:hypothetical protein